MLFKSHLTLFVAAIASTGMLAQADVITFAGAVTDTGSGVGQVTSWRTDTVTKTLDLTNSNVYGSSLGAVNWAQGQNGQQPLNSSTLG